MKQLLLSLLFVLLVVTQAEAQSRPELVAMGFRPSPVPNFTLLYPPAANADWWVTEVYTGEPVTWPVRRIVGGLPEGPQLSPTKLMVGGREVNPSAPGVWITPGSAPMYLRVHVHLPTLARLQALDPSTPIAAGFGYADGSPFYLANGQVVDRFVFAPWAFQNPGYVWSVFGSAELLSAPQVVAWMKVASVKNETFLKKEGLENPAPEKAEDDKKDEEVEAEAPEKDAPAEDPKKAFKNAFEK